MQIYPSRKRLMHWLVGVLLVYCGIMVAMFLLQRKLMYHPSKSWLSEEYHQQLEIEEFNLKAPDGTALQHWWIVGDAALPTIIYFHGNAGSLHDRADKFTSLNRLGFNILALSYRGYGESEGSPTEEGIYQDARTTLNHALEEKKLQPQQVLLYGESLGSGVAVEMATHYAVGGVILEAPYTSVIKRASEMYPWLPVPLLLKDDFDSLSKITNINAPLLIFHNEGDRVIPIHHGRQLFAAANEPKKAYWMDGAGHIEFDWDELAQKVAEYWKMQE